RALYALRPGGVLAAFVPAGLLASSRFSAWRRSLNDLAELTFIAALDEYHVVGYPGSALALLVLQRKKLSRDRSRDSVTVGWAADAVHAAAELRRAIRSPVTSSDAPPTEGRGEGWSVYTSTVEHWRRRPS